MTLTLSTLPKTWFIDIDGTIFVHNSHMEGGDRILPGVSDFFENIPKKDVIVLTTARKENYREATESSLAKFGLRYDRILFDLNAGERILINDRKPSGLTTAYALNVDRDGGLEHLLGSIMTSPAL